MLGRLLGLLILAIGLGVLYYFLLLPLQQAQAGVAEIRYSLRAFFFVPFCVIFGLAFMIGGSNLNYRNVEAKSLNPLGWTLFGLVVVLTGIGWWWFDQQFTALGYV
jgi:hypothetical protein